MMRKNTFNVVLATLTLALFGGAANAQTLFSENFDGGTLGVLTQTHGDPGAVNFADGAVQLGGVGDGGRSYVSTPDSNYISTSFVAEVTVTVQDDEDTGSNTHFFGIGPGLPGGTEPNSFNEPSAAPSIYFGVRGINNFVEFDSGTSCGGFAQPACPTPGAIGVQVAYTGGLDGNVGAGTHRLRMSFDSTAETVEFAINTDVDDPGDTGSFAVLTSLDASDNTLDATNSRLFFGSSDSRAFDDFEVKAFVEPLLPCDVNGNGVCNSTDFEAIRDSLFTAGARADGDLNGDDFIDFADYRLFKDDPNRVTGFDAAVAASIPEPTSVALLGLCTLLGAGVMRRSSPRNIVS